jgi:hypothetical protein
VGVRVGHVDTELRCDSLASFIFMPRGGGLVFICSVNESDRFPTGVRTVLVQKFLPRVRTSLHHNITTTALHYYIYAKSTPNFRRVRLKYTQRT